jgi:hypothetical protein
MDEDDLEWNWKAPDLSFGGEWHTAKVNNLWEATKGLLDADRLVAARPAHVYVGSLSKSEAMPASLCQLGVANATAAGTAPVCITRPARCG